MGSKVSVTLDFLAYEGSQTNDPADADKNAKTVEETAASAVFRNKKAIATGTTDEIITLPDSATDYLMIYSDRDISIKLNGISTALALKVKTAGTKCPVFFMRGTISALLISNASGSTANIDVVAINV